MTETAFRTCRLYKILGNPLRYKIPCALLVSPRTPTELAGLVRRPIPAVSKALSLLHGAGLVWYRTSGSHVVYCVRIDDAGWFLGCGEAFVRRHDLPASSPPSAAG